jgi:hypothetical protein
VLPEELAVKPFPEFKKVIDSVEFFAVQTKTPSFMNMDNTD